MLLTHPAIIDSAVIGVIDDDGEEIPKAFVTRLPGADLTAEEVVGFVASRVAPHKKIRRVEFIDTIPKSAAGKILRKELRPRNVWSDRVVREAVCGQLAPAPASWLGRAVRGDQFVEVMRDLLQWLGRARGAGNNDGTFDRGDDHRRQ